MRARDAHRWIVGYMAGVHLGYRDYMAGADVVFDGGSHR